MKNILYCKTPIGKLTIVEEKNSIIELCFTVEGITGTKEVKEIATPLLEEARKQLEEYFKGDRKIFNLPLRLKGTEFQKKVWEALLDIPYGETASYKDIAKSIGNEKASRAVGNANNKNPLPIFIPCHRIIGANGKLVGYGGGLDIKIKLLELENRNR